MSANGIDTESCESSRAPKRVRCNDGVAVRRLFRKVDAPSSIEDPRDSLTFGSAVDKAMRDNAGNSTTLPSIDLGRTQEQATACVPRDNASLSQKITELDKDVLIEILLRAARRHTDVSIHVRETFEEVMAAREQQGVVKRPSFIDEFDHHSRSVWYILNRKYPMDKDLQIPRRDDCATEEVFEIVERIGGDVKDSAKYATKVSALFTLGKIAKIIARAGPEGHAVEEVMMTDGPLAQIMIKILRSMTIDERATAGDEADSKGPLKHKIGELMHEKSGMCMWIKEWEQIIDLLTPYGEDGDMSDY